VNIQETAAWQRYIEETGDIGTAWQDVPAYLQKHFLKQVCPKCGGETGVQHYGPEHYTGETYVQYCIECNWRGEPE
jgi:hypothetical protein